MPPLSPYTVSQPRRFVNNRDITLHILVNSFNCILLHIPYTENVSKQKLHILMVYTLGFPTFTDYTFWLVPNPSLEIRNH